MAPYKFLTTTKVETLCCKKALGSLDVVVRRSQVFLKGYLEFESIACHQAFSLKLDRPPMFNNTVVHFLSFHARDRQTVSDEGESALDHLWSCA